MPSPSTQSPLRSYRLALILGALLIVAVAVAVAIAFWTASTVRAQDDPASAPSGSDTTVDTPAESTDGPPPPRADGLPAETSLTVTELAVRDLPLVRDFYRDAIGLTVIEESESTAVLGFESAIIRLVTTDDPLPDAAEAGLYHTAILFADAPTLAQSLARLATTAPERYQGSADHRVSLAFYLSDPEGNGVELYVDRPREEWVWENGLVQMGSEALDVNAFITEHLGAEAVGSATLGHMHLRVGDLAEARAFYADTLGFDVVSESTGALFYSAGGYHHHFATNIWQSEGAGLRSSTAGLGSITIALPDAASLDAVAERIEVTGFVAERGEGTLTTRDPWGNRIVFTDTAA